MKIIIIGLLALANISALYADITVNGKKYKGNNLLINNEEIFIDGKRISDVEGNNIQISFVGDVGSIQSDESVYVNGNAGSIDAKGSVTANDVIGDIIAGGSVNAKTIKGNTQARGSVKARTIKGDVKAGGSVKCGW